MAGRAFLCAALVGAAALLAAPAAPAQDEDDAFFDPGAGGDPYVEEGVDNGVVVQAEPDPLPEPVPVEEPPVQEAPEPPADQPMDAPEPGVEPPDGLNGQAPPDLEEPPAAGPAVRPANPLRPKVIPTRPPNRPGRPAGARTPPPPRPAGNENRPPRPAGDPEAKNGQTASEPVMFDFDRAPLTEVIAAIAKLTGRNFDIDPNIGGTEVTIITHDKIPPEMAYEVLESILASRGFSMVETLEGNLIKVIATPQGVTSEKVPLVQGAKVPAEGYDTFATHIVSVKYADAGELVTALKILGSPNARIDAYVPTNTLIITDTADGLRRVFEFLAQADVPGFDTIMEIFTLEFTRAEVISGQLEQVLLDTGAAGGAAQRGAQTVRTPARPTRGQVPGAATNQVIGTSEETLRMVPDDRLNALIVVATEGMMERVRDLVNRLDTPTPYEANNLHIYELLNADAEQVEEAIQPLIGGSGGGGTSRRSAAAQGGQEGGAAARPAPRPASSGGGGAPDIQPFEQKVSVNRYDQTNSLLIVASPQDYKLLEAFIARLDVPQRQVAVNAAVMDVTIEDDFGLTVDAASIQGEDGFALTNTANIAEVASAAEQLADPGALGLALLGLGTGGGLTTGIFDDLTIELSNGQEITLPFVPLLMQAIEKLTYLEVLSEPSLVTVDNEEASIVVGQEVPFITSTSRPGSTQGNDNQNFAYGYTRVQREEVGVKLKVTPQISEGDNVLLEIEIEVSDTDATQIGTVDILGPTTNKTLIQNKVLVQDGYTAVIAGLIRDGAKRDVTQTPLLGDIPGLGWLFRSKTMRREKRNLVVLVTPHIIKEGIDYERVTQWKMSEYHKENLQDLVSMNNLFRKVKKKYEMRRTHRPTYEKAETLTGVAGVERPGKGDLAR